MIEVQQTDYLVIGTGVAGLSFALKACELGKVTLIVKTKINEANSRMAQGGIASVTSIEDDFEKHINDTLIAGAGLCNESVVRSIVSSGPERIQELTQWGVQFDFKDSINAYSLHKEGGHSKRRILHVGDQTGKAIHQTLIEKARAHSNIEVRTDHLALELITKESACQGAYILEKATSKTYAIKAKQTILATGGAGKTYLYTSNWEGATGDGIAMAYRAGANIANMEFMQFHPTCLFHPKARNFLISEALRGEGAELINEKGEAFMKSYHPLASLAPRDIVARCIDTEIKKSGAECVYLDITHKSKQFLQQHFPNIYKRCLELGIDIAEKPIPVVPAAHYLCGGVVTTINGETNIKNLYALGETACTGLHGANRLASNSLLECLAISHNAYENIKKTPPAEALQLNAPEWPTGEAPDPDELFVISHMWDEIRRLMWNYVGIVRTNRRLQRALSRITNIKNEVDEYYGHYKTHSDVVELRNIAQVAELTILCALKRHESRGINYNLDYPNTSEQAIDTTISPH